MRGLGIYFIFGTKLFWNEGIDFCFNVECVLLGRNFDYFGDYLIVTARCVVVTARYVVVTGGYCSLLVVTACYRSLLLIPTFSMNAFSIIFTSLMIALISLYLDSERLTVILFEFIIKP